MKSVSKSIKVALILLAVMALSSCSLGQATTAAPTPTAVDVNAVMTSAAATAFVQLTDIAAKASPTIAPTQTPTQAVTATTGLDGAATATQDVALLLLTPTEGAGGLPAVATPTAANGLPATTPIPSLTPFVPVAAGGGAVVTCFNAKFVADMSIPDGTVMKPYEKFYKVWRIENTGTCKWDEGFGLTLWAGESMGGNTIYFSKNDKPVEPGGVVDLGIEMRAPVQPGEYIAHWTMIDDQGKTFGGDLMVYIKVVK